MRKYLTTPEAAEYLNVSASWLNKSRMDGSGPPYSTFGKSVRYCIDDLADWAKSNRIASAPMTRPNIVEAEHGTSSTSDEG